MDKYASKIINMRLLKWAGILFAGNAIGMYYIAHESAGNDIPGIRMSYTRLISKSTGQIAQLQIPKILRKPIYSLYGWMYDVQYEDMLDENLSNYTSLQSFFTRAVKQRQINNDVNTLLSPADSRVLTFQKIDSNSVLLVKGMTYSLGHFLTGQENYIITPEILETFKKRQNTNLYSVIFYLAPGDYHRYHSPSQMSIKSRNHVAGHLSPVKISHISKVKGVYENNERVALFGTYSFGFMSMILVGALNVGSMTLNYDNKFLTNTPIDDKLYTYEFYNDEIKIDRGSEVGMFKMGSTVVLIFEAEDVKWLIEENQKCRYGQVFAEVK